MLANVFFFCLFAFIIAKLLARGKIKKTEKLREELQTTMFQRVMELEGIAQRHAYEGERQKLLFENELLRRKIDGDGNTVNNYRVQNNYSSEDNVAVDPLLKARQMTTGAQKFPSFSPPVEDYIEVLAIKNEGVVLLDQVVADGTFERKEATEALHKFTKDKKAEELYAKNGERFFFFRKYNSEALH